MYCVVHGGGGGGEGEMWFIVTCSARDYNS